VHLLWCVKSLPERLTLVLPQELSPTVNGSYLLPSPETILHTLTATAMSNATSEAQPSIAEEQVDVLLRRDEDTGDDGTQWLDLPADARLEATGFTEHRPQRHSRRLLPSSSSSSSSSDEEEASQVMETTKAAFDTAEWQQLRQQQQHREVEEAQQQQQWRQQHEDDDEEEEQQQQQHHHHHHHREEQEEALIPTAAASNESATDDPISAVAGVPVAATASDTVMAPQQMFTIRTSRSVAAQDDRDQEVSSVPVAAVTVDQAAKDATAEDRRATSPDTHAQPPLVTPQLEPHELQREQLAPTQKPVLDQTPIDHREEHADDGGGDDDLDRAVREQWQWPIASGLESILPPTLPEQQQPEPQPESQPEPELEPVDEQEAVYNRVAAAHHTAHVLISVLRHWRSSRRRRRHSTLSSTTETETVAESDPAAASPPPGWFEGGTTSASSVSSDNSRSPSSWHEVLTTASDTRGEWASPQQAQSAPPPGVIVNHTAEEDGHPTSPMHGDPPHAVESARFEELQAIEAEMSAVLAAAKAKVASVHRLVTEEEKLNRQGSSPAAEAGAPPRRPSLLAQTLAGQQAVAARPVRHSNAADAASARKPHRWSTETGDQLRGVAAAGGTAEGTLPSSKEPEPLAIQRSPDPMRGETSVQVVARLPMNSRGRPGSAAEQRRHPAQEAAAAPSARQQQHGWSLTRDKAKLSAAQEKRRRQREYAERNRQGRPRRPSGAKAKIDYHHHGAAAAAIAARRRRRTPPSYRRHPPEEDADHEQQQQQEEDTNAWHAQARAQLSKIDYRSQAARAARLMPYSPPPQAAATLVWTTPAADAAVRVSSSRARGRLAQAQGGGDSQSWGWRSPDDAMNDAICYAGPAASDGAHGTSIERVREAAVHRCGWPLRAVHVLHAPCAATGAGGDNGIDHDKN
jgi:hypothetical protein